MANSKLLKEAIADAKAVRETAIANAKIALEEAFAPKLNSMLSKKIQEELDGDDFGGGDNAPSSHSSQLGGGGSPSTYSSSTSKLASTNPDTDEEDADLGLEDDNYEVISEDGIPGEDQSRIYEDDYEFDLDELLRELEGDELGDLDENDEFDLDEDIEFELDENDEFDLDEDIEFELDENDEFDLDEDIEFDLDENDEFDLDENSNYLREFTANDSYAYEVQSEVAKKLRGKNIHGWNITVHPRSGAHTYNHPAYDVDIYATPLWETSDGIPYEYDNFTPSELNALKSSGIRTHGHLNFYPTGILSKDINHAISSISNFLRLVTRALGKIQENTNLGESDEFDLDEIIREMGYGDDVLESDEITLESNPYEDELEEAYNVIKSLKKTINEVNLLNAKLLYTNKLFRAYNMTNEQKHKVIDTLDRTHTLREVKLVFGTLNESFKMNEGEIQRKPTRKLTESFASSTIQTTSPKREILSEGNELAERFKQLANIK